MMALQYLKVYLQYMAMEAMLRLNWLFALLNEKTYYAIISDSPRSIFVSFASNKVFYLRCYQENAIGNIGGQSRKLCHIIQ